MKKNKDNQLPPHLLNYWTKGLIKDGAIIKKKIINIKIIIEDKNNIKELVTEFLQQNHSWSFLSGYNTEYGFTVLKKR